MSAHAVECLSKTLRHIASVVADPADDDNAIGPAEKRERIRDRRDWWSVDDNEIVRRLRLLEQSFHGTALDQLGGVGWQRPAGDEYVECPLLYSLLQLN